jgi:hypothetical protein
MDSLILTPLTQSAPLLYRLIDNCAAPASGCPACPGIPDQQPPMPYAVYPPPPEAQRYPDLQLNPLTPGYPSLPPPMTRFACPLRQDPSGDTSGTFIRNGITAAFVPSVWDAFSGAHGGRDGSDGFPPAKRVLVVMTDGQNTIAPIPPASPWPDNPFARYDSQGDAEGDQATIAAASLAKAGPDGQAQTDDDIEIYTIGFFDRGYSGLTGTTPPLCPAATQPANYMQRADRVLTSVSSSTSGSCDHYYPLAKPGSGAHDDALPSIFAAIAGRIKRAQLVE